MLFDLGWLRVELKVLMMLQTWVKITDGQYEDSSCSNVYEHIVRTLSRLKQRDVVWTFADWALQRNQEVSEYPYSATVEKYKKYYNYNK